MKQFIGNLRRAFETCEACSIPVSFADPQQADTPLVFVNDAFCQATGYVKAQCVGRNCRLLQGKDTTSTHVDVLRAGLGKQRSVTSCILNYRADGTPLHNMVFISHAENDNGEIIVMGSQFAFRETVKSTQIARHVRKLSQIEKQVFSYPENDNCDDVSLDDKINKADRMVTAYLRFMDVKKIKDGIVKRYH